MNESEKCDANFPIPAERKNISIFSCDYARRVYEIYLHTRYDASMMVRIKSGNDVHSTIVQAENALGKQNKCAIICACFIQLSVHLRKYRMCLLLGGKIIRSSRHKLASRGWITA